MNILKSDKTTVGGWIQTGSVIIADIMAGSNCFDWICIDLEHGPISIESVANLVTVISSHCVAPIVRVPENDYKWIGRSLDAGAQGIIVPMVNNVEQAESAVRYTKYPPKGMRGFGYSHCNGYGRTFKDYIKNANNNISLVVQIEHSIAMDNLYSILRVDGVDGSFIGPLDLKGSIDINMDDMLFDKYMRRYLDMCKDAGSPAGIHIVEPNKILLQAAVVEGYRMIAVGTDAVLLRLGMDSVL